MTYKYFINKVKNASVQRAVLRDGGRNSSEILFNFAAAVARPSGSETRHLAKPPPRYRQAGQCGADTSRKTEE